MYEEDKVKEIKKREDLESSGSKRSYELLHGRRGKKRFQIIADLCLSCGYLWECIEVCQESSI
jgi:formate hydrogenlyase subunit 6/NADH:ubiquinone oxidoreductase subunit I